MSSLSSLTLAGEASFYRERFDELRSTGKPIVIHAYSKSCSRCKKQATLVRSLLDMMEFKSITVMRADYTAENALRKELKVSKESTSLDDRRRANESR